MPSTSTSGAIILTARMRSVRLPGRKRNFFLFRTFAVLISDPVERFDLGEVGSDGAEFFSDPLDVGIDGSVIDIDILTISHINQLIPVFNVTGSYCQRLKQQVFGDRQIDGLAVPCAFMTGIVKHQRTPDYLVAAFLGFAAL